MVQHSTGGIWKFPILFVAINPEVDDVIDIEAIGLNKESVVSFKLTSQTRYEYSKQNVSSICLLE